jgi:hypothetical protein
LVVGGAIGGIGGEHAGGFMYDANTVTRPQRRGTVDAEQIYYRGVFRGLREAGLNNVP